MSEVEATSVGRERIKKRLRVAIAIPVLIVGAILVLGVSVTMNAIARQEVVDDIFTDAAELPPELIDEVVWQPDPELARVIDPTTRENITASWLRAWEQMSIVAQTGDASGVDAYFAGPARVGVLAQVELWNGRSVEQLGHDLELRFISIDGQVVEVRSHASRLERTDQVEGGTLVQQTTESYDAVLILEDGNWRINHLVRRSFTPGEWELVP